MLIQKIIITTYIKKTHAIREKKVKSDLPKEVTGKLR